MKLFYTKLKLLVNDFVFDTTLDYNYIHLYIYKEFIKTT